MERSFGLILPTSEGQRLERFGSPMVKRLTSLRSQSLKTVKTPRSSPEESEHVRRRLSYPRLGLI